MGTISSNPNEEIVSATGVRRRESLTGAGPDSGEFARLSALVKIEAARWQLYARGHSEVSDDDLITAAQCGDQQGICGTVCAAHCCQ